MDPWKLSHPLPVASCVSSAMESREELSPFTHLSSNAVQFIFWLLFINETLLFLIIEVMLVMEVIQALSFCSTYLHPSCSGQFYLYLDIGEGVWLHTEAHGLECP